MSKLHQDLKTAFDEIDTDEDGRIDAAQLGSLMKQMGIEVYGPKLQKMMNLVNYKLLIEGRKVEEERNKRAQQPKSEIAQEGEEGAGEDKKQVDYEKLSKTITFEQFCEIYLMKADPFKGTLLKLGYQLGGSLSEMREQIGEVRIHDRESRGNLKVKVGEVTQYDNNILVQFFKRKSKAVNPELNILLFVESHTPEAVPIIKSALHEAFKTVFSMMKSEQPVVSELIDSIKLEATEKDGGVEISLKVLNEDLNKFNDLMNEKLEQLFGAYVEGSVSLEYKSNFDFLKMMDMEDMEGSIFGLLTRDMEVEVSWASGEIISALKKIAILLTFFDALTYDKSNASALFFISLINSQMLSGEFEFQNSDVLQKQTQEPLVQEINGIQQQLVSQMMGASSFLEAVGFLNLGPVIDNMGSQISLRIFYADFDFKILLRIKHLHEILQKIFSGGQSGYESD